MSELNVEIVRRVYEAWARDEFSGSLELFDAEVEYVNPAGAVEPGTRRGLEAFARTAGGPVPLQPVRMPHDVAGGVEGTVTASEDIWPAGDPVAGQDQRAKRARHAGHAGSRGALDV